MVRLTMNQVKKKKKPYTDIVREVSIIAQT